MNQSDVEYMGRQAFLLTWNPDNWHWEDFDQCVSATATSDGVIGRSWATGNLKRGIRPGDRVFLLRQGKHGRGIVGSGRATDFSDTAGPYAEIIYSDAHWNGSRTTANYVDVLWDRIVDPVDLLPITHLKTVFPEQNWSPMGSGTRVRTEVVDALEASWSQHVGGVYVRDSDRRKAIENAAQDWLMQVYRDEGWSVQDTRYGGPYDALATKDRQTRYLEAKGTQSSGDAVLITRGEVDHARKHCGECVIGIWSSMRFTDDGEIDPNAGEKTLMPFEPDNGALTALQYRWQWNTADRLSSPDGWR